MEKVFVGLFLCISYRYNGVESVKVTKALDYLAKYGYLEANGMSDTSQLDAASFEKSLQDFQLMAGLPLTGKFDENTQEAMKMPRCGVSDKVISHGRYRRFATEGSRWTNRNLKFKITKYPRRLNPKLVDKEIQKAFDVWSKYTDLVFEPTTHQANIEVEFLVNRHGDGEPFDGPGGTLAHAYFPQYGGGTHFDDDENWSNDTHFGTNLLQVATHEFGHALGLQHSEKRSSLMSPFYQTQLFNIDLYPDDIQGIQDLYGKKRFKSFLPIPEVPENPKRPSLVPDNAQNRPLIPVHPNNSPENPDNRNELPLNPDNPQEPNKPVANPNRPNKPSFNSDKPETSPLFPRDPNVPPTYPDNSNETSLNPDNPQEPPLFPGFLNESPTNPRGRPSFPEISNKPHIPQKPFPRFPFLPSFPAFPIHLPVYPNNPRKPPLFPGFANTLYINSKNIPTLEIEYSIKTSIISSNSP